MAYKSGHLVFSQPGALPAPALEQLIEAVVALDLRRRGGGFVSGYTMTVTLDRPYDETVMAVREALTAQGFGVLTEIDVRATMKAKLDVDVPAQVILGACRPELAHRAFSATPSVAALLPVQRRGPRQPRRPRPLVEAHRPRRLGAGSRTSPVIRAVAADARERPATPPSGTHPSRRGGAHAARADDMTAVINRAKRAHGHLGKVISMMEAGADCEDVLTQLAAVIKAIERTGFQIVATGLHQCLAAGDGPERRRQEDGKALPRPGLRPTLTGPPTTPGERNR